MGSEPNLVGAIQADVEKGKGVQGSRTHWEQVWEGAKATTRLCRRSDHTEGTRVTLSGTHELKVGVTVLCALGELPALCVGPR